VGNTTRAAALNAALVAITMERHKEKGTITPTASSHARIASSRETRIAPVRRIATGANSGLA